MVAWLLVIQGVALVHIAWCCSMAAQQTWMVLWYTNIPSKACQLHCVTFIGLIVDTSMIPSMNPKGPTDVCTFQ